MHVENLLDGFPEHQRQFIKLVIQFFVAFRFLFDEKHMILGVSIFHPSSTVT